MSVDRRNSIADKDLWKLANVTWNHMVAFGLRIAEVIDGTGSKKLIIAYGPPGIAKTYMVNKKLGEYYLRLEKAWRETDPEMRDPRHTITEAFGAQKFKEPFITVPGRTTARRLYMILYEYSNPGDIVVLDDLSYDPQIQVLIHQASDKSNNYLVTWDTSKDIYHTDDNGNLKYYDRRFNFHGSLIIVNNVKKNSIEMGKKYSEALRDRAHEIFFPWDRQDIGVYVDRLGFGEGGLYRFICRPKPHGLGRTMTPQDSVPILKDVRGYFISHLGEIKNISFRLLEDLVSDRITYGVDWEKMAAHTIGK